MKQIHQFTVGLLVGWYTKKNEIAAILVAQLS